MFNDEKALVDHFIGSLQSISSPWGQVQYATEFFYQRGRTDLVALSDSGNVIAIEAKLTKWRIALQQAYRNRCFADLSYVLLPQTSAKVALNHLDEFITRGVGICSMSDNEIKVLFDAKQDDPIQPWLREQAILHASGEGRGVDADREITEKLLAAKYPKSKIENTITNNSLETAHNPPTNYAKQLVKEVAKSLTKDIER